MQHWWQESTDPVLVVTGGAGVGKTSLIKEWVRTIHQSSSSDDDPKIHAVEYATARTDTGYPAGLLSALSSQLAGSMEHYVEFFQRQSRVEQHFHNNQLIQRNDGTVIGFQVQLGQRFRLADYDWLMHAPFRELYGEKRLPPGGVTIVIDGLDEIAIDRDDEISFLEAVARPVPGVRLLLTMRTAAVTSSLRRFPSFDLVSDEPPTSNDLADFVAARLAATLDLDRSRLINRMVDYCDGRFVLARAWVDHLNTVHRDGASPTELARLVELPPPTGIATAWGTLLDKFGGSDHVRDLRHLPVLRIAALARDDGLPGEVLRAAVGHHHRDLQPQISNILDELRDFFRRVDRPDAPLRLCHVSLEEYLTGPHEGSSGSDFTVAQGHLAIAEVLGDGSRWNGNNSDVASYAQKNLLTHLVAAIPADRAAAQQMSKELLDQPEFVEAVTKRLGVERFQWELERLAAAFGHPVWPVNNLAFLLGRQIAQLRDIRTETDECFLLRQLLHAARACGADTAEDYRRRLAARSFPGLQLETVWATGGRELTSREFEHGYAPVNAVAIVDECRFVTAGDDGSASIWDVRSGQRRRLPGDGSRIRAVAASANWILTGSGRGAIQVWRVETDTRYPSLSCPGGPVIALALLPDGERGVSLSASGQVRVWSLHDARELALVEAPETNPVQSDAHRPTIMAVAAGRILTASANGCIVVTDPQGKSRQLVLWHPGDELTAAALSPDGHYAVSGGADGDVVLWNLGEGGRPHHLPDGGRPDSRVTALVVNAGGHFVVAGSGVGARLWDTETNTGELLVGDVAISALALVPGDRHVVTASLDHRLRLWNLNSRRLLHLFTGHRDRICSLTMDPSGRRMVSASYDGTARLWHLPVTAERTVLQGHSARPTAMSLTADGASLVVADIGGTIWRRNLVDGHGEEPGRGSPHRITALIPSAGEQMMVGTADGAAGVWDVQTSAFVHKVEPHPVRVTALATVSDSDEWMVATYADGLARLWHRRTAESLSLIRHSSGFTAAAATLLGSTPAVLLAAEDHTLRLWEVGSKKWRWERSGHAMKILSIAMCDENEYAITAALDGTVRLWRVSDGTSWDFTAAHRAEATTVTAGPGMLAVSGARDGSAIVWDLRERAARHHLDHGNTVDAVTAVAFTPSGRHVVTGSSDGGVRLWEIGAMVGRRLTHPRVRLMLDGPVTQLLVAPEGNRGVIATATGQLTCVELP